MRRRAALLAAIVAGCTSVTRLYDGPARPSDEVARITVSDITPLPTAHPGDYAFETWIVGWNGRDLDKRTKQVEVLPGEYRILVAWKRSEIPAWVVVEEGRVTAWEMTHEGKTTVRVQAEAGAFYAVEYDLGSSIGAMEVKRRETE